MDLKKTLSLCLALLLVVGFAGFAQAADPDGVRIRVIRPTASGGWVGIGDSIVIHLETITTVSLDSATVAITDSGTTLSTTIGTNGTINGVTAASAETDKFTTTLATSKTTTDPKFPKQWRFSFIVAAGDSTSQRVLPGGAIGSGGGLPIANMIVAARVHVGGTAKILTNRNTDVILGSTEFGTVGDNVKLGKDGARPTVSAITVGIDTTGTAAGFFPGSTSARAFNTGKLVKVRMVPTNPPIGATGVLYLVDPDSVSKVPLRALRTSEFAYTQLALATARDSFVLAAGDVSGTVDNQRVKAVAFLKDQANNLSGVSAYAAASGFSDALVHVFDTAAPNVTAVYPNPDSGWIRFTGKDTIQRGLVATASGALTSTTFTLKPLKFSVDEGVSLASIVTLPDSGSFVINPSTISAGVTRTMVDLEDSLTVNGVGGTTLKVTISVADSAGNTGTKAMSGLTYDEQAPTLDANITFPTSASAPKNSASSPVITSATKDPLIKYSETLDSLAVRYIAANENPPTKTSIQQLSPGTAELSTPDAETRITVTDSLISGKLYTLQFFMKDLAGNVLLTAPDSLVYDNAFTNPTGDSFRVEVVGVPDSVIAGQAMQVRITALDTQETAVRTAVIHGADAILRLDAGGQDLSHVTIQGMNDASVKDNGDGTAYLGAAGWVVGSRSVIIKSTKAIPKFKAIAEDTAMVDGVKKVSIKGEKDSLVVDAAEFSAYKVEPVSLVNDVLTAATAIKGAFQVQVTPVDQFDNPSTKVRQAAGEAATAAIAIGDSTGLLSSRVAGTVKELKEIYAEFSSNVADCRLPSGPQVVAKAGSIFQGLGPNRSGTGLVISVRSVNAAADTSGGSVSLLKQDLAVGSSAELAFAGEGGELPAPSGDVAAPDSLIVQDYWGADGLGDQGGFVMVTFPASDDHATVSQYRLYREIEVDIGIVNGELVELTTPAETMVSWTVIDPVPDATVVRAVVPTMDNVPTDWAIAAEKGRTSSELKAAKRVFSKESVQRLVQFLGVDPNRVLTSEELSNMFTPPKDYVKALLGDQKNIVFAALDPDLTSLFSTTSVPNNILTQSGQIVSSEKTVTAEPVAAVDNIPPKPATDAEGSHLAGEVTLSWTASADDKVVGFSSYRGFTIPIAGVASYEIMRGADESSLESIATLPPGSDSYTDSDLPEGLSTVVYRVDALDLDNPTEGELVAVSVQVDREEFTSADGDPVYIINPNDPTPFKVDFTDFLAFASSFNKAPGEAGFNVQADTDDDGDVDFQDFLKFAASWGREAIAPATKPVIVPQKPGLNENVELSLQLGSDRVLAGETVTVEVSLANGKALTGYGFQLAYDPDKFEFVEAAPAEADLLKAENGETPIFLTHSEAGKVDVANALIDGGSVTGEGMVATLTFKVLREFEDEARFEIAEGVVFDTQQLTNPVVVLDALSVESTPTEFALIQNYPNPFNPETTIKYNLAEGAEVQLRIYNIVGQLVRTLVAEQQPAGRYQVRWAGRDDRGMVVSSGIYFYQIAAGKFSDVKRLMLLK